MKYKLPLLGIAIASIILVAEGASASPGTTTRVSVDSAGNQANYASEFPSISEDGRHVAFVSYASNLVSGDTNGEYDVFVHDRQTGETARVSVDSAGNQANGSSGEPSLSADGRYVAFTSHASNLVPGDTNGKQDIFVHDRLTGETTRASVDSAGNQANGESHEPAISADGRYVAFNSQAFNLVPGDPYGINDIFVHDRQTNETTRVSVDSLGNRANGFSSSPAISADGHYVAFTSYASNLVPGDTNSCEAYLEPGRCIDVFVHDRQSGETTRVSVDSTGNEANSENSSPAISADGRYVAFSSRASNLVSGDTNGKRDIFVHDRQAGVTTRVSVGSGGNEGIGGMYGILGPAAISADGRYVTFDSDFTNLVPGDTNGTDDIFVHDRGTGQTVRVSVDSTGNQASGWSEFPVISADGRYIAFSSDASNLVPEDTNACGEYAEGGRCPDIFVHDRFSEPGPTTPAGRTETLPTVGGGRLPNTAYGAPGTVLAVVAASGALLAAGGAWYARRRRRVD